MEFKYQGSNIHYQRMGNQESITTLIMLHGWGTNHHTFDYVINHFKDHILIYAIDLPGFGLSDEPSWIYSLDDYVKLLATFIDELKITNPVILGHSFGGRIAISYASNHRVEKLILVDSAGVSKKSLKVRLKILWFKLVKNIHKILHKKLKKEYGSTDYQQASTTMKKILIKVTNTNQIKQLSLIQADTLLIWGALDKTTPLRDGKLMAKKIAKNGLVVFETAGHFPYLEEKRRFCLVIGSFLSIPIGGK